MNITHDKESGALYIRLRDGFYSHTEDFSEKADVYLDVDADGTVLGLEALSFEDLAQAIEERGGKLDVPVRWGGATGRAATLTVGEIAQEAAEAAGQVAQEAVEEAAGSVAGGGPGRGALLDAVSSLEPREQELLRMFFLEGMNIVEVAEYLEVPLTEAQRARSVALAHLRAALDEREVGEVGHADLEALLSRL